MLEYIYDRSVSPEPLRAPRAELPDLPMRLRSSLYLSRFLLIANRIKSYILLILKPTIVDFLDFF